jgi:hypothetical protein
MADASLNLMILGQNHHLLIDISIRPRDKGQGDEQRPPLGPKAGLLLEALQRVILVRFDAKIWRDWKISGLGMA